MVIIQLDSEQLFEVIENALRKVMSEQPISTTPADGKTIFNLTQLCEYTGLSGQTVYKKTSQGLIPNSKRGKRLFFDKAEIDKWLLENSVGGVSETNRKADAYLSTTRRRRATR